MPTVQPRRDPDERAPSEAERENLAIQEALAWFTGLLVAVGFLQVIVLAFQAVLLRRTLSATETAADAARDSAEIAEKTLRVSQRAYIHIDGWECVRFIPNEQPFFRFKITNLGKTPGTITEAELHLGGTLTNDDPQPLLRNLVLPPNSSVSQPLERGGRPISEIEHSAVVDGKTHCYLWGHLRYEDIFGEAHVTRFLADYQPRENSFTFPAVAGFTEAD